MFPVAVTVYITWWFLSFFDNLFSPIFYKIFDFNVFGLGARPCRCRPTPCDMRRADMRRAGSQPRAASTASPRPTLRAALPCLQAGFVTSMLFIFLTGVFFSSWLGSALLGIGAHGHAPLAATFTMQVAWPMICAPLLSSESCLLPTPAQANGSSAGCPCSTRSTRPRSRSAPPSTRRTKRRKRSRWASPRVGRVGRRARGGAGGCWWSPAQLGGGALAEGRRSLALLRLARMAARRVPICREWRPRATPNSQPTGPAPAHPSNTPTPRAGVCADQAPTARGAGHRLHNRPHSAADGRAGPQAERGEGGLPELL